jgi:hypothetical protein
MEAEDKTVRQMLLSGEINDHTAQKLFQELTLGQARLGPARKA